MPVPQRTHPKDVGLDLTAMAVESHSERLFFIDTGVSVEPPEGFTWRWLLVPVCPRRISFWPIQLVSLILTTEVEFG